MDCNQIREGLIVDYLDGFMPENEKKTYDEHLSYCYDCRNYFNDLKETASMPFQAFRGQTPPQDVWPSIKERILTDSAAGSPFSFDAFWDTLQSFLTLKRVSILIPAFAVVMVAVLPLLPSPNNSYPTTGGYMIQSMDYTPGDLYEQEFGDSGFGSTIEELLM